MASGDEACFTRQKGHRAVLSNQAILLLLRQAHAEINVSMQMVQRRTRHRFETCGRLWKKKSGPKWGRHHGAEMNYTVGEDIKAERRGARSYSRFSVRFLSAFFLSAFFSATRCEQGEARRTNGEMETMRRRLKVSTHTSRLTIHMCPTIIPWEPAHPRSRPTPPHQRWALRESPSSSWRDAQSHRTWGEECGVRGGRPSVSQGGGPV